MQNNIESLFVPYAEALALKELGFNEECFGWYNPQVNYKEVTTDKYWAFHLTGEWENFKPAPLYQQAFRWFREKYDLTISIKRNRKYKTVKRYEVTIDASTDDKFDIFGMDYYDSYEEAELACLIKLIEIV
jgi:hypothetical protein